jgi:hypothetical protein
MKPGAKVGGGVGVGALVGAAVGRGFNKTQLPNFRAIPL